MYGDGLSKVPALQGFTLGVVIENTTLVVQWLRFHASIAGGTALIPGWGTKITYATWHGQKNK